MHYKRTLAYHVQSLNLGAPSNIISGYGNSVVCADVWNWPAARENVSLSSFYKSCLDNFFLLPSRGGGGRSREPKANKRDRGREGIKV